MSSEQAGPKRLKAATDWRELHQRIEAARLAVDGASVPDAGILRQRARVLAREPARAESADAPEWVEFLLAQEKYALESRHVREVHVLEDLTPLPCTPDFVLGIVNLRGEILSVIDLKKFFGLPEKGLTDLNKIIVLESANMRFGVLADAILGVRRIPSAEIQPSLPTLTGIREKYLKGVSRERTVLLDAGKLLADEAIIVQEQV
ncbi:MAG TPA: chemotaxis protein CheW [Rhodocyclaceae bacterium]|nr:chemotaxis protein CheW [Rhodocyclaceae bacterium]